MFLFFFFTVVEHRKQVKAEVAQKSKVLPFDQYFLFHSYAFFIIFSLMFVVSGRWATLCHSPKWKKTGASKTAGKETLVEDPLLGSIKSKKAKKTKASEGASQ